MVLCYIDGSHVHRNKKESAGIACWLVPKGYSSKTELRYSKRIDDIWKSTSQRAEIIAAIEALRLFKESTVIQVISDCECLIKCMKGDFNRKKNMDLWEVIDEICKSHKVDWKWERRASRPELSWCDVHARKVARGKEEVNEYIQERRRL